MNQDATEQKPRLWFDCRAVELEDGELAVELAISGMRTDEQTVLVSQWLLSVVTQHAPELVPLLGGQFKVALS